MELTNRTREAINRIRLMARTETEGYFHEHKTLYEEGMETKIVAKEFRKCYDDKFNIISDEKPVDLYTRINTWIYEEIG